MSCSYDLLMTGCGILANQSNPERPKGETTAVWGRLMLTARSEIEQLHAAVAAVTAERNELCVRLNMPRGAHTQGANDGK